MADANQKQFGALTDYTRIVAPFDGVVTMRFADNGSVQRLDSHLHGIAYMNLRCNRFWNRQYQSQFRNFRDADHRN